MKSWKSLAAVIAFSAAVVGAPAPLAAEEMMMQEPMPAPMPPQEQGIISFSIAGHDAVAVYFLVEVSPALEGQPAKIRFGDAPFTGNQIGGAILHAGMQMVAAPNPGSPGWYTIECAGRIKTVEDTTVGVH
jgi:hypothetical protein